MRCPFRLAAAAFVLAATAAVAQPPAYDAIVVEPWDDSYSLASSTIGDINDLNVAVGRAHIDFGQSSAFLWTVAGGKEAADIGASEINNAGVTAASGAIYWAPGDYFLVPHPADLFAVGIRDLNNHNVACGTAGISERTLGMIWDETDGSRYLEDLGVPPTSWRAYAINDAGLLAGSRSLTGEPGDEKGFALDTATETYIDLHTLLNPGGGGITRFVDVAENGFVTGEGSYGDDAGIAGFLWSAGEGFTQLPALGGGLTMDVHPNSVNSEGTVVGQAIDGGGEWRAFIWNESYGMHDLEDLATLPAGFNLEEAKVINENGWIVARGFWGAAWGPERAVMFVPADQTAAPDPGSAATGLSLRSVQRAATPGARFAFVLPADATVSITVYDLRGRRVAVLDAGGRPAGEHRLDWDGRARDGRQAPAGVYLAQLRADGAATTTKLVITR